MKVAVQDSRAPVVSQRPDSLAEGRYSFSILPRDGSTPDRVWRMDPYFASEAFIRGDFDIEGDLCAALRYHQTMQHSRAGGLLADLAARWLHSRPASWWRHRRGSATVRFHYDRSNAFFREFLDPRMVYSCAYFNRPGLSLEEAQLAKLDLVCRKLDIQRGDRFLDVGCGWGALIFHAAQEWGAHAFGCTVAAEQAAQVRAEIDAHGLTRCVQLIECDYTEANGQFDRIASVGMFEHVEPYRLGSYLRTIHRLLKPDGLFLNHGIVRPQNQADGAETLFIERRVFPDGHLVHLSDLVREAELSNFEILDVENLRPHYALTCRKWVERLQANRDRCLEHVDESTWRTWLLYLAGSAIAFEDGVIEIHQVLMSKRGSAGRKSTREYMYRTDRN